MDKGSLSAREDDLKTVLVNLTFGLRVARGSSHEAASRHRERGC